MDSVSLGGQSPKHKIDPGKWQTAKVHKSQLKWIKDLDIRSKAKKFLVENTGKKSSWNWSWQCFFLNSTPKAQTFGKSQILDNCTEKLNSTMSTIMWWTWACSRRSSSSVIMVGMIPTILPLIPGLLSGEFSHQLGTQKKPCSHLLNASHPLADIPGGGI